MKNYCQALCLTISFLFLINFTTQGQTVVYDYLVIVIDPAYTTISIAENGEEYIARKLKKEEQRRGVTPALEMIKERNKDGWELFSTAVQLNSHIFYLRRVEKEATEIDK